MNVRYPGMKMEYSKYTPKSSIKPVLALKGDTVVKKFRSLMEASEYFEINRTTAAARIKRGSEVNGIVLVYEDKFQMPKQKNEDIERKATENFKRKPYCVGGYYGKKR